ncbi:S-layer homology domain-containing protein [Patescibacteria group bacterium]|nr:S-layer homology domain-containing protein [Patescibacteria group bacterium]MBU1016209.1 S-layer homology domain-containing protein [Patescibacteria group bacterium]MBU1684674.1 S-layer homology domain-containing protein [Patescibacteria group bacterium]MBU1938925.1 S-layer homology domain-containing protein [Patescibacteria group bacterium]
MKKFIISFLAVFLLVSNTHALQEPKELIDIAGDPYETAIRYLAENNIVQGYPDGSYQPQKSLNRAEFTKIIVGARLGSEPPKPAEDCFPDVQKNEWFATWVCYAKDNGIIGGYPDSTFKPAKHINLAEAAKILVNTLNVDLSTDTSGQWYEVYIRSMQNNAYIPDSFRTVTQLVKRSQMAEMIYRIMEEIKSKPAKTFVFPLPTDTIVSPDLSCLDDQVPASVDMNEVRNQWLSWHNQARANRSMGPLTLNNGLDYSSSVWAKDNKSSKELTHNRPGGQSLTEWFSGLGIVFRDLTGMIYGESLGLRTFRCKESDCTEQAIEAARFIFDAFMAEEGTSYTSHYDNVIEPDFVELGVGIAIDYSDELMYLATHSSFGVDNYPSNPCE